MKLLLPTVATLFLANTALAQGPDNPEGFYVGVGLGNYEQEIEDFEDANFDFDEEESATRIFAGWRVNQFFSAQLDHYDFDETSAPVGLFNVSTDTEGWAPSVTGTLPLGPVDLYARVGILFYDLRVGVDNNSVFDDSGDDPVYAAGLGLTFAERLAVNLEYEIIDIEQFDKSEALWVMLGWRF